MPERFTPRGLFEFIKEWNRRTEDRANISAAQFAKVWPQIIAASDTTGGRLTIHIPEFYAKDKANRSIPVPDEWLQEAPAQRPGR